MCCHRCVIWKGHPLYREHVHILDLLSNCTVSGQCVVIKFLWSGQLRSSEIHRIMLAQYGERCMNGCRGLEMVKQVWPSEYYLHLAEGIVVLGKGMDVCQ